MSHLERQSNEFLVRWLALFLLAKLMTIKEARKILGKEAENLTDEEIALNIESAKFLKDLFFNNLTKNRKTTNTKS